MTNQQPITFKHAKLIANHQIARGRISTNDKSRELMPMIADKKSFHFRSSPVENHHSTKTAPITKITPYPPNHTIRQDSTVSPQQSHSKSTPQFDRESTQSHSESTRFDMESTGDSTYIILLIMYFACIVVINLPVFYVDNSYPEFIEYEKIRLENEISRRQKSTFSTSDFLRLSSRAKSSRSSSGHGLLSSKTRTIIIIRLGTSKVLLKEDGSQTTRELAEKMKCSTVTISGHLKSIVFSQKLGAWVPHELNETNKENRLQIAAQHLARHQSTRNHKQRFLYRIVTGNEKWYL
ncbi:SETMAR [Cordylochernes scorpioides]|uniref:SETMAR n=1 Tax=Cordylochernes scorpioides TaxID=51811 RepID=A0ABY6L5C1_9ARAC|nr:SETMAR [Cordylochernes scorpioides]